MQASLKTMRKSQIGLCAFLGSGRLVFDPTFSMDISKFRELYRQWRADENILRTYDKDRDMPDICEVFKINLNDKTSVLGCKPASSSNANQELDQNQYHTNFAWNDDIKMTEFFRQHGYVIVRDVLTVDECKASREEIEGAIRAKHPTFNMMDPNTHAEMTTVFNNYGMWGGPMLTLQMLRNRQNERLYHVFKTLYGGEESQLLVNHDSGCFYRATKPVLADAKTGTTATAFKPERATAYVYPGLHVDFHPAGYLDEKTVKEKRDSMRYATDSEWMLENNLLVKSDGLQLAGVLNLFPNRDEDGGFHCADGFTHVVDKWMKEQSDNGKWTANASIIGSYEFSAKDKVDMKHLAPLEFIRASAPEGALIVWNQLTAHGSRPNNSDRFRCAQFV